MDRVYLYDKPTCCGFIQHEINTTISCFLWGALSFYFAVLAFLGKSPFYSYINTVPLVAFGAANLLLGLMSTVAFIIFVIRRRAEQEMKFQTTNRNHCYRSNRLAHAVALSVVTVLVAALVCFILFISEKQDFLDWCITSSTSYVNATYNEVNTASNLTSINLSTSIDYYNCERLFQDEVKWSLMCLSVLLTVYLHWVVIIYTVRSNYFRFDPIADTIAYVDYPHLPHPPPPVVTGELNSIPPKKRGIISFNNVKPSKMKIPRNFKLLHKKTVNETTLPTQIDMEKSFQNDTSSAIKSDVNSAEATTDICNQSGNVIHFEDNIYDSKEEVVEPMEDRQGSDSFARPPSSVTLANISS